MGERLVGWLLVAGGVFIGATFTVFGKAPALSGVAQQLETPGFVLAFCLAGILVSVSVAMLWSETKRPA